MKTMVSASEIDISNIVNFRKNIFDEMESRNPDQICFRSSFCDIKNVVVIASSSRSGSSLLFSILKNIPSFYSLSGESVPFYKLNGLLNDAFASDEIPAELERSNDPLLGLSRDFLRDFSFAAGLRDILHNNKLIDQYVDDLALRFPLQWPGIRFSYNVLIGRARQAFDIHEKSHREFSKEEFYLELLWLLRREYKDINPYYYDIPAGMIASKFPALQVPLGPPHAPLAIEEPPFILLSPGRKADKGDLTDKTLLLKSSADCYRMQFIKSLMPNADIKIIYLVRNPAASINGLCDGWLHRGFFSHNLKTFFHENKKRLGFDNLKISGYSDKHEWGKWWWNFELPPGWQDHANSKLEEVCAFQWHSANRTIQEYLHKERKPYCMVKCENIIENLRTRKEEVGKIVDFIGLEGDVFKKLELSNLRVVHATEAPSFFRWKKRENVLLPILNTPKMSEMSAQFGYENNMQGWI